MYHGKNENGEWIKWMGTKSDIFGPNTLRSHFADYTYGPYEGQEDIVSGNMCVDNFTRIWQEGLGETSYQFWCYRYSEGRGLQGYIQDGDTTGIITPDSTLAYIDSTIFIMNENVLSAFDKVTLFPNPATNELNFNVETTAPIQQLEIVIYDTNGKAWKKQIFRDALIGKISVRDLPKGIYIITFRSDQELYSKKFVKW